MSAPATGRIDRGDGVALAYAYTPGAGPTAVFLPGFRSDMTGAKALEIEAYCETLDRACLRFDYSGHGESDGVFEDGTIGRWTEDALFLIDRLTEGELVLVGSSMGGWIALLVALARKPLVTGLVGIAAAPDFTEALIWDAMPPSERAALVRDGVMHVPSPYGERLSITHRLIEEGRTHCLMHAPIPLGCKVRLLHGQQDPDVPWQTAIRLAERLASDDVQVTLIKDGDHRLSRPSDLALLRTAVGALLYEDGP